MHRTFIFFFIFISGLSGILSGQPQIQWLSWEEAQEKAKKEKRKIFVDIYTEWCGWCKKMDKTTFADDKIVKHINTHYYAVKFDAETKNEILLKGKSYQFTRHGARGYHDLATTLLHGKMSFPSLAFLDEEFNLIQAIPGFKDDKYFMMISSYFAENAHKTTPWNKYTAEFERREGAVLVKPQK